LKNFNTDKRKSQDIESNAFQSLLKVTNQVCRFLL
jgi:hypothetical protein